MPKGKKKMPEIPQIPRLGLGTGVEEHYDNGQRSILLDKHGQGLLYYESGKIAAVITKTEKGYDHLFYNDDKDNTLVASFDAYGIGNILYPPGVDEAGGTLPKAPVGVGDAFYKPTGDTFKYEFWNRFGKQEVTHSGRPRLIISPQGGQMFSEGGVEEYCWEWGGILEPLPQVLEIKLNSSLRMSSSCQVDVRIDLTTPKIKATFQCGLQLKRTDTYLNRNEGISQIKSGPTRGKYELTETVAQKRGKVQTFKGQTCSEILYKPPEPPSIVTVPKHLEAERKALEGKDLSQDLKALDQTSLSVVANLIASDLENMKMLTKKPTDKRMWSLGIVLEKQKNKPLMKTRKPKKLDPIQAVDPLENEDEDPGEGRPSLGADYLPIPPVMKRASGAYRHRDGGPTKRISLKCINPPNVVYKMDKNFIKRPHLVHFDNGKRKEQFFAFVKDVQYKDRLISVCCLQQDSQRCRQTRCMCEDANGHIQRDKQLKKDHIMVEYNMTDSRFLMNHFRIRSVPMFLFYYNGRLVDALTTLNNGAAPTSLRDFLVQIETSLSDARSNRFKPDDFQFDPGCDNTLTTHFMDAKHKIRDDINMRAKADYAKVQKALELRNAEVEY